MSRGLIDIFHTTMKREGVSCYESTDLRAVSPGRFQVLDIDQDIFIKAFVFSQELAEVCKIIDTPRSKFIFYISIPIYTSHEINEPRRREAREGRRLKRFF